jgi:hypothetical protein
MIDFECPTCKQKMRIPPENAGRIGKCGRCKEIVRIPDNRNDFIPSPAPVTKVAEPVSAAASEAPPLPKDSWRYVLLFLLFGFPCILGIIKAAGMIQYLVYPAFVAGIGYLFYDATIRNQVFNSVSVFDPVKRFTILGVCGFLTINFLLAGDLDRPQTALTSLASMPEPTKAKVSDPPSPPTTEPVPPQSEPELPNVSVSGNTSLEKTVKLRNAIAKAIGTEGLSFSVSNYFEDPSKCVFQVRFRVGDNLTNGMIRSGAKVDIQRILQAADESGLEFHEITVFGSFPLVDKLGNESLDVVTKATYEGSTIKNINWNNFLFKNVYDIAQYHWLHPAFRE